MKYANYVSPENVPDSGQRTHWTSTAGVLTGWFLRTIRLDIPGGTDEANCHLVRVFLSPFVQRFSRTHGGTEFEESVVDSSSSKRIRLLGDRSEPNAV